jgi:hypothetical protein
MPHEILVPISGVKGRFNDGAAIEGCSARKPLGLQGEMHYEKLTRHITPREVAFIKELSRIRRLGGVIEKTKKIDDLSTMEKQNFFNVLQETTHSVKQALDQEQYSDMFSESLINEMANDVRDLLSLRDHDSATSSGSPLSSVN